MFEKRGVRVTEGNQFEAAAPPGPRRKRRWAMKSIPAGVNVPGANDLTALKKGAAYWIAITGPSSVSWTIAASVL